MFRFVGSYRQVPTICNVVGRVLVLGSHLRLLGVHCRCVFDGGLTNEWENSNCFTAMIGCGWSKILFQQP